MFCQKDGTMKFKTVIRVHGKINSITDVTHRTAVSLNNGDDEVNELINDGYSIAEIINYINESSGIITDVVYLIKEEDDDSNDNDDDSGDDGNLEMSLPQELVNLIKGYSVDDVDNA